VLLPVRTESRLGMFFMGFVFALVPGVAGTLWAISYLADNISQLVNIALLALLIACFLGTILVLLQGRLFRWLGLSVRARLADMAKPMHDAIVAGVEGDALAVGENLRIAAERGASWYTWVSIRRWIVGVTIGLLAGFAALIGSALLHEQNRLIRQQNEYFQLQNAKMETQIRMAESEGRILRRSQLIATLYDLQECAAPPCAPRASLRSRAEAFRALVALDHTAAGLVGAQRGHDYAGIDLRWAHLEALELGGASLRGADLRGAGLRGADLRGADLTNARLSSADLRGVDLRGARLGGADLRRADLRQANVPRGHLDDAVVDPTTLLPESDEPADIACALCCAAFATGRAAARAFDERGRVLPSSRQDLADELNLMGLAFELGVGPEARTSVLFQLAEELEPRLVSTLSLLAPVQQIRPEAMESYQLGLYLGHLSGRARTLSGFDVAGTLRILRGLVGRGRVAPATAAAGEADRHEAGFRAYDAAVRAALGCRGAE